MHILKVLGNDIRLQMVKLLEENEKMTHAEIIKALDAGVVTLHYHLQLMLEAGLIEKEEVDHRTIYYKLTDEVLGQGLRDLLYVEEV